MTCPSGYPFAKLFSIHIFQRVSLMNLVSVHVTYLFHVFTTIEDPRRGGLPPCAPHDQRCLFSQVSEQLQFWVRPSVVRRQGFSDLIQAIALVGCFCITRHLGTSCRSVVFMTQLIDKHPIVTKNSAIDIKYWTREWHHSRASRSEAWRYHSLWPSQVLNSP